jgi:hypothetical protein
MGAATLLITGAERGASVALAASIAVEVSAVGGIPTLLAELGPSARRRPTTLLASPAARGLEDRLRSTGWPASARGHLCHLALTGEGGDALEELADALSEVEPEVVVAQMPGKLWVPALEAERLGAVGGCVLLELPRQRSLAALASSELARRGLRAHVATTPPSALAARRAQAGVPVGGRSSVRAARIARRLLGLGERDGATGAGERGQALPAVLGAGAALILTALLLAAIVGAVTGKGRAQRAADLAALSAVRSMRDDVDRLLEPARLPGGAPNPGHLPRAVYFARARAAAADAARRNGVDPARLRIGFPDGASVPPLRASARVTAEIDPEELPGGERLEGERREPIEVEAGAVAEASPPAGSWSGLPGQASGGGYSGPLVYRNGEGMRPDVGAAFDRMAAAARRDGHELVVSSGFRSDAEQAELWERHPDPSWVAPPGRSLHRCATELDLGPSSAYSWLAANARRFGFLQRYSWEPWHYGYVAGPPPCSPEGDAGGIGSSPARPDGAGSRESLPAFVPARYREPLLRSASRWNVSPGLLAAQLMAESGFNPRAVSPAGALGIAQFMPGTAASYGLRDPFDPIAAIDAQAHLMSDLLRQFHSVPLALAAYNAGPGAVAGCSCIPPYPETRAYVARVLALAGGAGVITTPPLEVRLVR